MVVKDSEVSYTVESHLKWSISVETKDMGDHARAIVVEGVEVWHGSIVEWPVALCVAKSMARLFNRNANG